LTQAYKICPICGSPAHPNASLCSTCGTTLEDVAATVEKPKRGSPLGGYDPRFGETDLLEADTRSRAPLVIATVLLAALLLVCGGMIFALGARMAASFAPPPTFTLVPTQGSAAQQTPLPLVTNTPRPTFVFVTVTPAPPTATATPTQGPCTVTVQPGNDLLGLAYSCGHRSMEIIPLILELNGLDAPENMQVGQVLEIPWPTPTPDPNAITTEEAAPEGDETALDPDETLAPVEQALAVSAALATQTLQPGVMWHRVSPQENILIIAERYGANIEILSQLNPQVTFSQCDYSSYTGGPNCIVLLYEGQLIRVPAPTPTPTIQPTASGSETATPTPTPTQNVPSLTSPGDLSLFRREDIITLRWVATGALTGDQVYRVTIEDTTEGIAYTADTRDLFFIVPPEWQGADTRRHEFRWSVSVVDTTAPDDPLYTTEPRRFSWEGLVEPTDVPATKAS
jgi:hypothetical protein